MENNGKELVLPPAPPLLGGVEGKFKKSFSVTLRTIRVSVVRSSIHRLHRFTQIPRPTAPTSYH